MHFGSKLSLLFFTLATLSPTTLHAQGQTFSFQHVPTDARISRSTVGAILQDQHGFMWFGTEDGLIRYDGHTYVAYINEPNDPHSISNNSVYALLEDGEGTLWIGTEEGLNRFDRATETFTHYLHDPDDPSSLSHDSISSLYEDHAGELWVGTLDWSEVPNGGLNRFNRATETFTRYGNNTDDPKSLTSNRIRTLYEDRTGTLWVGTWGGLNRFDRSTESFTRYMHDLDDPRSLRYNDVYSILEDHKGVLWIGTIGGGLNRFDQVTESFTYFVHDPGNPSSLSGDYVTVLFEDRQGVLWVGTHRNGLNRFDRRTETFTRYMHDPDDPSSLTHNDVRSIYASREEVLWIGTWSGLNYVDPTVDAFSYFVHHPDDPTSLLSSPIEAILEDQGGILWLGTWDGLSRFDPQSETFTHYRYDPDDPRSLSPGRITAIDEDRDGSLWVGTDAGGLNHLDRETGAFRRYQHGAHNPVHVGGHPIRSIYQDREGALWVDIENGISHFDQETGTFTDYMRDADISSDAGSNDGTVLYEDRQGRFWVGTSQGGIDLFDRAGGTFTHFAFDPKSWAGLTVYNTRVTSIYEDRRGVLWVSTYANGLYHLDRSTSSLNHFLPRDAHLTGPILGMVEQEDGYPWIVSRDQLYRFDPQTRTSQIFGLKSGLLGQDVPNYSEVVFLSTSGELFYAIKTYAHLFSFSWKKLPGNTLPPQVVLTDLKLSNQSIGPGSGSPLQASITLMEHLTLSHDENNVSIDYTALHFINPEGHQFAYQLESYDEAWNYVGSQRRATYTNLDPGAYVFRVKAANSEGVWNEEGVSLGLTIRIPWWRTSWAYILYGVLLTAGVIVVDRFQRRRLISRERQRAMKRELAQVRQIEAMNTRLREHEQQLQAQNTLLGEQQKRLLELDEAKTRFFANISHELRTPLTLIIGPLEDLRTGILGALPTNVVEEIDLALHSARRMLRLVNQILDLSKLEAGQLKLHAQRADIVPLLNSLVLAFSPLSERKQITFQVELPAEPVLLYFDPDLLEKVFTNLLSNAFKFTPGQGTIRLHAARDRGGDADDGYTETVTVAVKDSGPGIPANELPRVFERFHQVEERRQWSQSGTGIGLSLAKELVELHGGWIEVESMEGFGTTFTVTLRSGKAHLSPGQVAEEMPGKGRKRELVGMTWTDAERACEEPAQPLPEEEDVTTVLVVDDNAEIRAYVRRHLEPSYRVVEAADGVEGLEAARQTLPDLILCDIMMPRMDGYALCRALKADPELGFLPVILLTARAAPEDKLEGLKEGADDYLTKPFSVEELAARVGNLIALRQRLRQHFDQVRVLQASPVDVVSAEEAFLERVRDVVEAHLTDETFGVEMLAAEVGMSRGHVHRRLRELARQTPTEVIRGIRLERAAQLLAGQAGSISEVAYGVGFKSVSHFSQRFRERYGVTPRAYATGAASH